jgi:ubiquinone/menaquinone biosynthesis C-methylase UbiE
VTTSRSRPLGGDAAATEYRRLSEPAYHGSFIARYNDLRPEPPAELIALLGALAPARPPRLVVDLGSGTGISTSAWSAHADRVVGIEHNPEMLAAARAAPRVEYRHALAQETGLPDACADVVTCAQSFHWMEHRSTIDEIARILRPEGVFAAYDYDWPPLVDWQVDAAFLAVLESSGVDPARPEKARHIERLHASGRFRWVREFFIHRRDSRGPETIALLPLAFGPVARKLGEGATPTELGLDRLRETIDKRIGAHEATLWWSYRVRCAVK